VVEKKRMLVEEDEDIAREAGEEELIRKIELIYQEG
jgi:hypothetical protein